MSPICAYYVQQTDPVEPSQLAESYNEATLFPTMEEALNAADSYAQCGEANSEWKGFYSAAVQPDPSGKWLGIVLVNEADLEDYLES